MLNTIASSVREDSETCIGQMLYFIYVLNVLREMDKHYEVNR